MRKLLANGALVATSMGALMGCVNPVENVGECRAMSQRGEKLELTSYPLGTIAVRYQEAREAFNQQEKTEGVVKQIDDDYVLEIPHLPEKLDNAYLVGDWNKNKTGAVVVISTPDFEAGLTPDCIDRTQKSQYGAPIVRVSLPTL